MAALVEIALEREVERLTAGGGLLVLDDAVEQLEHDQLDLLLFSFLNELVFLKDARQLLLRVESLSIEKPSSNFILKSVVYGEKPDPQKHPLRVDVKAVTLHRFSLQQTDEGWAASVILDI